MDMPPPGAPTKGFRRMAKQSLRRKLSGRLRNIHDCTRLGEATTILTFTGEFLEVTGLFERWAKGGPLSDTSSNAPSVQDVLVRGTWFLSILDGQHRYAHITGLRGDAVAPQLLGMKRIMSDESLRRALKHLALCPDDAKTDEQRAAYDAQLASLQFAEPLQPADMRKPKAIKRRHFAVKSIRCPTKKGYPEWTPALPRSTACARRFVAPT